MAMRVKIQSATRAFPAYEVDDYEVCDVNAFAALIELSPAYSQGETRVGTVRLVFIEGFLDTVVVE